MSKSTRLPIESPLVNRRLGTLKQMHLPSPDKDNLKKVNCFLCFFQKKEKKNFFKKLTAKKKIINFHSFKINFFQKKY